MHKNLISYLKFLLKSTNQHGVHSPFVFDLVTKCLYQYDKKCDYITKSTELKPKILQVNYRLLTYLKPATIQIIGEEIDAFERIFKTENIEKIKPSNSTQKTDCFLFTEAPTMEQFEAIIPKTHNDSFCIILKQNPILLEAIKQNKAVSVTVDCFDLLLVFFRTEQVKENFTIRL
uniref:hypothetical protein n=1 Tax=Flavobacterium sp. TaxID=239 RepID=UPI00404B6DEF